jgi:mannose-6-phosphate isomerase-like protein (cupin superfamily)
MKSLRIVIAIALSMLFAVATSAVIAAGTAPVIQVFDAATVRAAFVKGTPLAETAAYKVHASRRDGPGAAEVHTHDTDIFYVLEGSAEIVTGGRLSVAKEVAPGEIRADAIEDGTARNIGTGDVVVIPSGVPHWFRRVGAPIVYYVVKVTTESSRE